MPGSLPPGKFLARHWQKKPLLIRAAFDARSLAECGLPDHEGLEALAARDDVESRLIRNPGRNGRWKLEHGPFDALPSPSSRRWTALVQGVDLHLDAGRRMLDRFRFIPDARIDDLMISVAGDGGGVGPHVDSYDVFLLQLSGRRRWSIAAPTRKGAFAPSSVPGQPIRVIEAFVPDDTWVLEAGDMLYLPPGWAHDGVAVGSHCITASIGFRTPDRNSLRQAFLEHLADELAGTQDPAHHYRDPGLEPTRHPARLPAGLLDTMGRWLRDIPRRSGLIEDFIGCHLSEPKPQVWFEAAPRMRGTRAATSTANAATTATASFVLDRQSRMLWHRDRVYLNGERFRIEKPGLALMRTLADQRELHWSPSLASDIGDATVRDDVWQLLLDWCEQGWLHRADHRRPRKGTPRHAGT